MEHLHPTHTLAKLLELRHPPVLAIADGQQERLSAILDENIQYMQCLDLDIRILVAYSPSHRSQGIAGVDAFAPYLIRQLQAGQQRLVAARWQ